MVGHQNLSQQPKVFLELSENVKKVKNHSIMLSCSLYNAKSRHMGHGHENWNMIIDIG